MEKGTFCIDAITISNFRGYLGETTFELFPHTQNKKGIVLLGGPNGFGKTNLFDAIEWCLTGQVKRLIQDFEKRKEYAENKQRGLLRNSKAKPTDTVSVKITGHLGDKLVVINREFNGSKEYEGLSNKTTDLKIVCNDDVMINSKVGSALVEDTNIFSFDLSKTFYHRFVCSQEKNIHIYESGRQDFYQMFSGFLGGTDEINRIESNLNGNKEQKIKGLIQRLKDHISQLSTKLLEYEGQQKDIQEEITALEQNEKQDSGLLEKLKSYPSSLLYEGELTAENIDINFKEIKQKFRFLSKQIQDLKTIKLISKQKPAYNNVITFISELNKIIELKDFEKYVFNYFSENKELVLSTQNKDKDQLIKLRSEYNSFHEQISKRISNYELYINNLIEISQILYNDKISEFNWFKKEAESIKNQLSNLISIKGKLDTYSSTDKALSALRALVDNIEGLKLYRKDNPEANCPLCGSQETFSDENHEIALEAKKFLGEIDNYRSELSKEYKLVSSQVDVNLSRLEERLLSVLDKRITTINDTLNNLEKVISFKKACSKWTIEFNTLNDEILNEFIAKLRKFCKNKNDLHQLEYSIINTLKDETGKIQDVPSTVTSDGFLNMSELLQLSDRDKCEVLTSFKTTFENRLSNFSLLRNINEIETLDVTSRISILVSQKNGIENTTEMKNKQQKKSELDNLVQVTNESVIKNRKALEKLNMISSQIKSIRSEWEKDVAGKINQPLNNIYRRINRHNNYEKLIFQKPGRGTARKVEFDIENTQGIKMFIPNVVSAGQLSTISISSFLTIAMGQKALPFRCYFMDDPIQSMDDINILSFIDLLRVELSTSNCYIDQLFISTCDEDLEALILHKMRNFNINTTHFKFIGYGTHCLR